MNAGVQADPDLILGHAKDLGRLCRGHGTAAMSQKPVRQIVRFTHKTSLVANVTIIVTLAVLAVKTVFAVAEIDTRVGAGGLKLS